MATLALCIPAFNAAEHLPRLLESAHKQRIPFDEILVYNDCSTDNTADVAASFGARVINGPVNKGCSFGKNQLALAAKSEWLHFHDADDDLLPNFTKEVHHWINGSKDSCEVLILNFNYIDAVTGASLGNANHSAAALRADPLKYAIEHKLVNFGVYKRSGFLDCDGFDLDENVLYNEDTAFHQRLAKCGLKFDYLEEVTCINYRYQASMSASNKLKCARATYYVFAKVAHSDGKIYPSEICRQLWVCATMLAAVQDWDYVRKTLMLCKDLGYRSHPEGAPTFRFLAKINPLFAFRTREMMIRLFKPQLRTDG